ncbi:Major Facilitator Superfamily protein [Phytobacter ursingii]|jgi:MFS family permease|uniref:YbfB/YjiJ family MFS transporter n=1 Tax=Phytobacter ursingii TaxID=1972431 RepID=A0AB35RMY4_9ENTR|nr:MULTISPECIES: YbfB/YjiJ family MFS transporter [Enterobacteriaceae]HAT2607649.1 YbfB/YjiJ family MFS transporter [Kluyvera intermedia]MCL9670058.1 MFS transporter [Citrobacter sp. MNAZ 1397]MDV2862784.1 YbfB/YjiJ family MFS transporter [Phytobacter ursingii]VTP12929.1 Major Facilitator Superfamily protein [Phytobacter ursingii]GJL33823.1 MFS transporter [Enterobacter hormaechei]
MALRIALCGFIVLVVAMGIGRFAFTPQVPLMIRDGQLTLTSAGLVAAMNYLGYLLGAWDAMRASKHIEMRLYLGVAGAVALTFLSALADNAITHGALRLVIGAMSGWAMVLTAAWTNERLAHYARPGLSAAVFAGPGAGIALSGLLAVAIQSRALSSTAAWQVYGVLALVLVAFIARYLPRPGQLHRSGAQPEPLHLTTDLKRLVWSYSLAGFGYILPATFLSQMAALRFPGSLFAQFVWPVFGAAAVVGIGLSIALRHIGHSHQRLAIVLWLQGLGVVASCVLPGMSGLVIGALLVGGGFLCAVQLSLLYGRELAPNHTRYMAGLLTTGYAVGQLIGPMTSALSTWLTQRLEPALGLAGLALLVGGILVWKRTA